MARLGRLLCLLAVLSVPSIAHGEQAPIYPEYNGFERLSDGRYLLSFGYYSHNRAAVTIAPGSDNSFAPGDRDRNQPTTFQPGHHRYACTMIVAAPSSPPPQWTIRYGSVVTTTTSKVFETIYALADDGAPFAKQGLDLSNGTVNGCVNRAPVFTVSTTADVEPGTEQRAIAATVNQEIMLYAIVVDDGLPRNGTPSATWATKSGPGTVKFSSPVALQTVATFSARGEYVLELTGSDGSASTRVAVTILVRQ